MKCEHCNNVIDDEDIRTVFEDRGHGQVREEIMTGYYCSNCEVEASV